MSADNWSVCPKCPENDEYHSDDRQYNLREDYEFYLQGSILNIDYRCKCKVCGFLFVYNKSVDVLDTEG